MEKVVFDSSNFSEINYMNFDADFKIKIKDKIIFEYKGKTSRLFLY